MSCSVRFPDELHELLTGEDDPASAPEASEDCEKGSDTMACSVCGIEVPDELDEYLREPDSPEEDEPKAPQR